MAVRGRATLAQTVHDGCVVAEHPRGSRERVLINPGLLSEKPGFPL
jgi:hypothetical protein